MERKKIRKYFEKIVNGEGLKSEQLKPSPYQLLLALDLLEVDAENAVYVGDASQDIEAGKSAGTKTIAMIKNPFSTLEKIQEKNPDDKISDLTELENLLR